MWDRADFAAAFFQEGMWLVATVQVQASGLTYTIHAGLREADELFADGNSQHTHYRFKFETDGLPRLSVGDAVTIGGNAYTVKDMPAFVGTGWFSICNLQRTTRIYPKRPIAFPGDGPIVPLPPAPPPASGGGSSTLTSWLLTTNGAQTFALASSVTAVAWILINGVVQAPGSFLFIAPLLTFPASLQLYAGDTVGAVLIS